MIAHGEPAQSLRVRRRLHLRYDGTDTALPVDAGDEASMRAQFETAYRQRFAFLMPERPLVIDSAVVEALGVSGQGARLAPPGSRDGPLEPQARVPVFAQGAWHDAPLYRREQMIAGDVIDGPAVIAEATATTVIEPGWRAAMTARGDLVLERHLARPGSVALGTEADPVMLEIFNNLFMSIAEQMGYRLQNTAHSVNIKERLDFSCAVFDRAGNLVANAPHMPVHLGSMGASVRAVIDAHSGPQAAARGAPRSSRATSTC